MTTEPGIYRKGVAQSSMRLLFHRIRFGRFLRLQCREEALRNRMIPAIALATPADYPAEGVEGLANIIADVLTATIGVKQCPARRRFLMASIASALSTSSSGLRSERL